MTDDENLERNTNIVRAALGGDVVTTQNLFNDALNDRVQAKVDALRSDVAASYLSQEQEPQVDGDSSE